MNFARTNHLHERTLNMRQLRLMAILAAAFFAIALGTVLSRAERNRRLSREAESKKELAAAVVSAPKLTKPAQSVPSNPDRDCFFGQTHSHTSWSMDAYLIGNHLTTPEDAYKYSLGMPVKHPAGFEVQLKGRPLDFHGVTDHSEYAGTMALAQDPNSELGKMPVSKH